jgi:hypothetical protein
MVSAAPTRLRIVQDQRQVDPQRNREDQDEFRHRMKVNFVAAIVLLALLTFGIWLADAMVDAQKVQGCYASGAHSCSLI